MTGVDSISALFVFVMDKIAVELEFLQVLDSSPNQDHSTNILHTFLPYLRHNTILGIENVFR